jgi:hypothetical protein
MRPRPLLFAATALCSLGCVGLDLAQFDDDELARLLDESPAESREGPGPSGGAGDGEGEDEGEDAAPDPVEPGRSTVVDEVPEFQPPPADPPEPPRDEAIILATETVEGLIVEESTPQASADAEPEVDAKPDPDRADRLEFALLDRNLLDEPEDAPGRPEGVVVASVGDEEIRLPELTRSIRRRIDRLPDGQAPNRRTVIAMVRAEMEARILASLVEQQARKTIPDEAELARIRSEIARSWSETELPRILRREDLADASALDDDLAGRGRSLDDLRAAFESRALAKELIRREGLDDEGLDAYFNRLRDRFPIASDLIPSGAFPAG